MRATSESNCTEFFSRVGTPVSSYIYIFLPWLRHFYVYCKLSFRSSDSRVVTEHSKTWELRFKPLGLRKTWIVISHFQKECCSYKLSKSWTHPLVLNQSWCYWNKLLQLKCAGNQFPPVSLKQNTENVHGPLLTVRESMPPERGAGCFDAPPGFRKKFWAALKLGCLELPHDEWREIKLKLKKPL